MNKDWKPERFAPATTQMVAHPNGGYVEYEAARTEIARLRDGIRALPETLPDELKALNHPYSAKKIAALFALVEGA